MKMKDEKLAAEKMSAYIDDALNVSEVDVLIADSQPLEHADKSFSSAARYHMMGDALRDELSDASMVDVSAQIHQTLLHESFDKVEAVRPVKKSSLSESLFAWLDSFSRPLAGMAVAASVAALMVVTVVQMESPDGGQQLVVSPSVSVDALVANKSPANDLLNQEQRMAEFDTYLTEHAEFAAQDTLRGRIPYVRAVSYEAE